MEKGQHRSLLAQPNSEAWVVTPLGRAAKIAGLPAPSAWRIRTQDNYPFLSFCLVFTHFTCFYPKYRLTARAYSCRRPVREPTWRRTRIGALDYSCCVNLVLRCQTKVQSQISYVSNRNPLCCLG